jgi:phage tail sheath gpL-like
MGITASNLATGVGATAENVQFQANATIIPRNILVCGPGIPATCTANGVVNGKVAQVLSSAQGINTYGSGSILARLITAVFQGSNGAVQVWALPEADGSAAATQASALTVTASTPGVGTVNFYINGTAYSANTTAASTPTSIAAALNTLINADANCPVTSSPTAGVLALTAKSKGVYGNFISLSFNSGPSDVTPTGVTGAVVAMAAGTVTSPLANDLNSGLGIGSVANILPNGQQVTDLVHGFTQDATSITAISTYNGAGNTPTGLYDGTVGRPIRALDGHTLATGAAALTAALAIGTTNISDRTNGLICAPGSLTHPSELAAIAIGVMARINNTRAEQNSIGQILPGVDPGYACALAGNRWTDQYTSRDSAVQGGLSPTLCVGSGVYLQNVVTFYHPASVPVTSNAYREMVNISKVQNILASIRTNFSGPKWIGYTIVSDVKNVTVGASRLFARDLDSVIDDYVALAKSWAANAWIYDPTFTIKALANKANPAVQVRVGGDGFTANVPVILSGVGNIIDTMINMDISLAVLSN